MKVRKETWLQVSLCCVFILFYVSHLSAHRLPYEEGDIEAMKQFADIRLMEILDNVPMGREKDFGFMNRSEFKKTTLGIPYQEYDFEKEEPTGYWRIPVTVDGENRALIRLKKTGGGWSFSGFGGAGLARELGGYEDDLVRKGTKPRTGRIVRDFSLFCDYIQFDQMPGAPLSGKIFPLQSAARIILMSGTDKSVSRRGYNLSKIKEMRSKVKLLKKNRKSSGNTTKEVKE